MFRAVYFRPATFITRSFQTEPAAPSEEARIGTRSPNITERSGKKKGKRMGRIFLPIRRRALPPPPFPPDNCDTTRHDTEKPLFNHEVRGARNIFDDAKLHVTNWFPATAREHATGSRRRRRANKNDLTLFSRSKHGRGGGGGGGTIKAGSVYSNAWNRSSWEYIIYGRFNGETVDEETDKRTAFAVTDKLARVRDSIEFSSARYL